MNDTQLSQSGYLLASFIKLDTFINVFQLILLDVTHILDQIVAFNYRLEHPHQAALDHLRIAEEVSAFFCFVYPQVNLYFFTRWTLCSCVC